MTLIISEDGVKNTEGTDVKMGKAKIKIGRDLVNESKMSLHDTDLEIGNDFIQKGDFKVNDPQLFAKAVLKLAESAKNATELGIEVFKLLKGKK